MSEKTKFSEKEMKSVEREIEKLLVSASKTAANGEYSKTASIYQEIARLSHSINDRHAVDFCLDAVKYSKKSKDNFKIGWSYKCAAEYSLAFDDFNNAISFATNAVKYFSDSNSMYVAQWCYNIIGKAAEKIKDYQLALKSYKKSLDIEHSDEISDKVRAISSMANNKK